MQKTKYYGLPEYMPDFVVETDGFILMVETKSTQHRHADGSWSEEVREKAKVGVKWCANASNYFKKHQAKEWKYLLIPHDEVNEQNALDNFIGLFEKVK